MTIRVQSSRVTLRPEPVESSSLVFDYTDKAMFELEALAQKTGRRDCVSVMIYETCWQDKNRSISRVGFWSVVG